MVTSSAAGLSYLLGCRDFGAASGRRPWPIRHQRLQTSRLSLRMPGSALRLNFVSLLLRTTDRPCQIIVSQRSYPSVKTGVRLLVGRQGLSPWQEVLNDCLALLQLNQTLEGNFVTYPANRKVQYPHWEHPSHAIVHVDVCKAMWSPQRALLLLEQPISSKKAGVTGLPIPSILRRATLAQCGCETSSTRGLLCQMQQAARNAG